MGPRLNAALNAVSAVLLIVGYLFIRRREIAAHRVCMLGAFGVSSLFLISYLTYHYQVGTVRFPGTGWLRSVYLTILATHTILAALVPPLAVVTLSRALSARFDRHRRIARWTLPIWLYVSITGVVVYWMLYHLADADDPPRTHTYCCWSAGSASPLSPPGACRYSISAEEERQCSCCIR